MESKIGVKGCINIITKYSRRHLSFFLCPAALPCSVLWEETSFPFSSGQFNPIHRSSCDEFFVVVFSKIHQMGIRSSLHGNILNVCALERVYAFMKCMWISIHPFINGRSLLEVGIVRKSINVFLNHFVAELVLLLQRGERKKNSYISWSYQSVTVQSLKSSSPQSERHCILSGQQLVNQPALSPFLTLENTDLVFTDVTEQESQGSLFSQTSTGQRRHWSIERMWV